MSSTKFFAFFSSFFRVCRKSVLRVLFFGDRLLASLTFKEKKLILVLLLLFIVLWFARGIEIFNELQPEAPVYGGVYKEVSFGSVENFNPFFAESRVEKDVSRILFLYLVDYNEKGELKGQILKKFNFKESQGELVFRSDIYWHDGTKVGPDDFLFTLSLFKKVKALALWGKTWSKIKAKKVASDKVVLSYSQEEKIEPKLLRFPLLPAHLLKDKDLSRLQGFNFNLQPVGNGPFKFAGIQRLKTGDLIVKLSRFDSFPFKSYLKEIQIIVKPSIEEASSAFKSLPFLGLGQMLLSEAKDFKDKKTTFHLVSLSQYTAVFYNLKKEKFKELKVRQALDKAIDREKIAANIPFIELTSLPLPAGAKKTKTEFDTKEARSLLSAKKLEINLLYSDSYPYNEVASLLVEFWEKAGVKVVLIPMDELSLADRVFSGDFEAVLWAEAIGRDWDLSRWYSQSELNFSGFASEKVDRLLAEANNKREEKVEIAEAVASDYPASFLFSVPYIWATRGVGGASLSIQGDQPSDRFKEVSQWYLAPSK